MSHSDRLGLSLSGGGYRATAFHLGTLKKLNEMNILHEVDVISTISGGSITGASYCVSQKRNQSFDEFYNGLYEGLQKKNIINRLLFRTTTGWTMIFLILLLLGSIYFLFTDNAWIFLVVWAVVIIAMLKYQFRILPISKTLEEIYDRFFYHDITLDQLPDTPALVVGSTNLQTARPFIFSKERMGDSTYQFMDNPVEFTPIGFPVARAVMASSCVPFAFTPVTIDPKFFKDESEADQFHPVLVDGGVYDNQGIHKVMQKGMYACDIVITSDAGSGSSGELKFRNTFSLLMETVNVFMSRIKKIQMVHNVYDNASAAGKQIAYFSLGWDVENCIDGFANNLEKNQVPKSVIEAHEFDAVWMEAPEIYRKEIIAHLIKRTGYDQMVKPTDDEKHIARNVGTNLTALSKVKVDCLIKQAAALTELQVKLYCPALIKTYG